MRILFVCLGNICRSPTAEGVFEAMVVEQGHSDWIKVDSCGTGDWHLGYPPDRRAQAVAIERGYDLSLLRSRQIKAADFKKYHYILAMDDSNLADLEMMKPESFSGHLGLFLDYVPEVELQEVPDPYYGNNDGFSYVLDLVEQASAALLAEIVRAHRD
ncbi:MAG: low molecular weight protein-tyrosine-phosphatase [Parahaliea sp.]